jgi:hypothetical protein
MKKVVLLILMAGAGYVFAEEEGVWVLGEQMPKDRLHSNDGVPSDSNQIR